MRTSRGSYLNECPQSTKKGIFNVGQLLRDVDTNDKLSSHLDSALPSLILCLSVLKIK